MNESNTVSEIRLANMVFLHQNLVRISVSDLGRTLEMELNAAGLVRALQLNAVHCYRQITGDKLASLAVQINHLPLKQFSTSELIFLAARMSGLTTADGAMMLWGAWSAAFFSAKLTPLQVSELTPEHIRAFCDRRLLYLPEGQEYQLIKRANQNDESSETEVLWSGTTADNALCRQLRRYNPAVDVFVDCR